MSLSSAFTDKFFFERHTGGQRIVLVFVDLYGELFQEALSEFEELARSSGLDILELIIAKRSKPEPKYFVGEGKLDEIKAAIGQHEAQTVIFSHDLSPSQERNLEKALKVRVMDRTGLILEIFARRARTFEGKLQVELAQLKHLSTRLVKGWTHLERQKGGIGLRGGPGETQLEVDRRLIAHRIKIVHERLKKVMTQRAQSRRRRSRSTVPTIALVGYTNAGKSTLFNQLTQSAVLAADQLFATLDPTLRTVELPPIGQVILADTVGFIRDLPHDLVAAFRATLEETRQADLLLHIVDVNRPDKEFLIDAVNKVLEEISAADVPCVLVFNKIDLRSELTPHTDQNAEGHPSRVWCSAQTGSGIPELKTAILNCLSTNLIECDIVLPSTAGALRARLYSKKIVISERQEHPDNLNNQGRIILRVRLELNELEKLLQEPGVEQCPS